MTHEIKTQQGDISTSQIQTDMEPFSVLQNMLRTLVSQGPQVN